MKIGRRLLAKLRAPSGFWYLATPYSKYPAGLEKAYVDAARCKGWLVGQKVRVFSPICHTHGAAVFTGIDPLDHATWLWDDEPYMRLAHGLLVAEMEGWDKSIGVAYEIERFLEQKKPIEHLKWSGTDEEV